MLKYLYVSPSDFIVDAARPRRRPPGRSGADGRVITIAVGVLWLGVPFDPGRIDWPLLVVTLALGLGAIIAIGLLLAGDRPPDPPGIVVVPGSHGRGAVPRERGGVPARPSCHAPVQAFGLVDAADLVGRGRPRAPSSRTARRSIGGPGSLVDRRHRNGGARTPRPSSSPCWRPGRSLHSPPRGSSA